MLNENKKNGNCLFLLFITEFMLLSLGWFAGPWAESTDQSTVLGPSCPFSCYGNLARVCGSMVPQPFSVPPPFFLHNPYQVCMRTREKHRCLISLNVAFSFLFFFWNVPSALIVKEIDLIRKLWWRKVPTNLLILKRSLYKKVALIVLFGRTLILLE